MSRNVVIYALSDPRDNTIRYVGQTANIKARYQTFIGTGSGIAVQNWFHELRQQGLEPIVTILETVSDVYANERERLYIKQALDDGCILLNQKHNPLFMREKKQTTEPVRRTFIIPADLYERLQQVAEFEGRDVNRQVVYILRKFLDQYGA